MVCPADPHVRNLPIKGFGVEAPPHRGLEELDEGWREMTNLLTEREVLNRMSWPCRAAIDRMINKDGFPKPIKRYRGLGDQWLSTDIDRWLGVGENDNAEAKIQDKIHSISHDGSLR